MVSLLCKVINKFLNILSEFFFKNFMIFFPNSGLKLLERYSCFIFVDIQFTKRKKKICKVNFYPVFICSKYIFG